MQLFISDVVNETFRCSVVSDSDVLLHAEKNTVLVANISNINLILIFIFSIFGRFFNTKF